MSGSTSSQSAEPKRAGGPTDPSHDELLRRGVIETHVSRSVALTLVTCFIACIVALPLSQVVLDHRAGEESVLLELFRHAPTRESLQQFEADLEQASRAKNFVQPRIQALLTRFGRAGNSKAVVGSKRWLYYKPGIEHVSGPGFLDEEVHRLRRQAAEEAGEGELHPDPRPAILRFHADLKARGIELLLLPIPDKAMLQPRELHGRGDVTRPRPVGQNADWQQFVAELRAAGVTVFDPTPARLEPGDAPRFLTQDTHWTPRWMQQVARELSLHIAKSRVLPPLTEPPRWSVVPVQAQRVGDIVDMLKLPETQTLFAPEQVNLERVQRADGEPWEPDAAADVLLLGDSFSNVFSQEFMGWGSGSGFAPQLARALGRPLDVIAQNDSGAFATRQELARELAAGSPRLAGKRLVIWEFACRELSVGDWKPTPLPNAPVALEGP